MDYCKKCDSDIKLVPCRNNGYIPKLIITHCKSKKECIYHYPIHYYLSLLDCNGSDKIRRCISNIFSAMIYPHSDYEILRHWQIPNQNTSDR